MGRSRTQSLRQLLITVTTLVLLLVSAACGDVNRAGDTVSTPATLERSFEDARLVAETMADVREGNLQHAQEAIVSNSLTFPDQQLAFFVAASCDSSSVTFLIDDVGFDPRVSSEGETAVYALVRPDFRDPLDGPQCADTQRAEAVGVLLDRGADPCRAPDWAQQDVPALQAASWGRSIEIVELLTAYAEDCEL